MSARDFCWPFEQRRARAFDRIYPRWALHRVVLEWCAVTGTHIRELSLACGYTPHYLASAFANESKFTDELAARVAETMLALAGPGSRSR